LRLDVCTVFEPGMRVPREKYGMQSKRLTSVFGAYILVANEIKRKDSWIPVFDKKMPRVAESSSVDRRELPWRAGTLIPR